MPETTLHPLKTVRALVLGVILCAAVGLGCSFAGGSAANHQPPQPDAVMLQSRLTEISELAAEDYHYTNMARFENGSDFYGVGLPFYHQTLHSHLRRGNQGRTQPGKGPGRHVAAAVLRTAGGYTLTVR